MWQSFGKHKVSPARILLGSVIWGLKCVNSSRVRDVGLQSAANFNRVSLDCMVFVVPAQPTESASTALPAAIIIFEI